MSEYPDYEAITDYHDTPKPGTKSVTGGFYGQHDHPMRSLHMPKPSRLDQHWRDIIAALPSARFTPAQRESAFGMRLGLAIVASSMKKKVQYLEVGVRMGHSLAAVCLAAGDNLGYAIGVDCFIPDYDGEPNPGPLEVLSRLADCGVEDLKPVTIYDADSHVKLRELAKKRRRFNLILVDGDHTETGAAQDLEDAWALLTGGGSLVFDDILAKDDRTLLHVWRRFVRAHGDQAIESHHEVFTDQPGWALLVKGKRG